MQTINTANVWIVSKKLEASGIRKWKIAIVARSKKRLTMIDMEYFTSTTF